jgi:hypothetical protein
MSKKEAYMQKLQAQLDEWSADIKKLNTEVAYSPSDYPFTFDVPKTCCKKTDTEYCKNG